jgi:hypothetical protein
MLLRTAAETVLVNVELPVARSEIVTPEGVTVGAAEAVDGVKNEEMRAVRRCWLFSDDSEDGAAPLPATGAIAKQDLVPEVRRSARKQRWRKAAHEA